MKASLQVRSSRPWRALPIMLAATLMAQPIQAADPPWCGARDRDLGDGFHATLYMMDGSPEFRLVFDVPAGGTIVNDAVLARTPVQIIFGFVDAPPSSPWGLTIGYRNLDLRERNGHRLDPDIYQLECGPGVALSLVSSHDRSREFPPGPTDFSSLFFAGYRPNQLRPETNACFEALQRSGHFRFSLGRRQGEPPSLVLEGAWPLAAAVERVRALWRRDMERARLGQCRLAPSPPPVF
jgi:hypothetical protein